VVRSFLNGRGWDHRERSGRDDGEVGSPNVCPVDALSVVCRRRRDRDVAETFDVEYQK
jgi:hypothetical protein